MLSLLITVRVTEPATLDEGNATDVPSPFLEACHRLDGLDLVQQSCGLVQPVEYTVDSQPVCTVLTSPRYEAGDRCLSNTGVEARLSALAVDHASSTSWPNGKATRKHKHIQHREVSNSTFCRHYLPYVPSAKTRP